MSILSIGQDVISDLYKSDEAYRRIEVLLDSTEVLGLKKESLVLALDCRNVIPLKEGKYTLRKKIKKVYYELDSLVRFYSSSSRLGETSFDFSRFKELEYLHLIADSLIIVPQSIKQCQNIKLLNVSINRFKELPKWLFEHSTIQILNVSDNASINTLILPNNVGQNVSLLKLNLNKANIVNIPVLFLNFVGLIELDLSENNFSKIPLSIKKCTNLHKLNLAGNPITEFPEGIRYLNSLEYLNLKETQIEDIPKWVFEMKNLKHLGLPSTYFNKHLEELFEKDLDNKYYPIKLF